MKELLQIAKDAIRAKLEGFEIDKEALIKKYPDLAKKQAVFVTLTLDNNLRGCIGSLIAHRSLIDDLIHNAQSAAFGDPRFSPLTKEEFERVKIEVSLLSEPTKVEYDDVSDLKQKIRVGVDGVILKLGSYQATFLPQVWEQLNSFDLFFAHLCQKAGLNYECLNEHPDIYTYHVEKIK